jgi:hypothetical protein
MLHDYKDIDSHLNKAMSLLKSFTFSNGSQDKHSKEEIVLYLLFTTLNEISIGFIFLALSFVPKLKWVKLLILNLCLCHTRNILIKFFKDF